MAVGRNVYRYLCVVLAKGGGAWLPKAPPPAVSAPAPKGMVEFHWQGA